MLLSPMSPNRDLIMVLALPEVESHTSHRPDKSPPSPKESDLAIAGLPLPVPLPVPAPPACKRVSLCGASFNLLDWVALDLN